MNRDQLASSLRRHRVVPVVTIDDAADAPALGRALVEGGLPLAEITFRTGAAAEAIAALREAVPDVVVGAGTVLDPATADRAAAAGAQFAVTPGFNPAVVDRCLELGIPVVPGVSTPTEVEMGLSRGLNLLKFFPAEAAGGLRMISALAGPYRDVRFMPTGGVTLDNLPQYLSHPAVLACGGTWLATAALIAEHRFERVRDNVAAAVAVVASLGSVSPSASATAPERTLQPTEK